MTEAGRGRFLVFEGIDGCGKSSQAQALIASLESRGHRPLHLREPGSTPPGEKVRELLLDPETGDLDPRCEALLFMACRSHLVTTQIKPALQRGEIVVCERFHPSTISYQGAGLGLGTDRVLQLAQWTTPDFEPDLVILLDLPAQEAMKRISLHPDRLEARGQEYLERVRQGFLQWAQGRKGASILDATLPLEEVKSLVQREVDLVLPR